MSFRLVPKSVTLNDLERRNDFDKYAFQLICVYDVVVKKVHVRYLISWWASCFVLSQFTHIWWTDSWTFRLWLRAWQPCNLHRCSAVKN